MDRFGSDLERIWSGLDRIESACIGFGSDWIGFGLDLNRIWKESGSDYDEKSKVFLRNLVGFTYVREMSAFMQSWGQLVAN